jgi:SAM-dependent methyltransferase
VPLPFLVRIPGQTFAHDVVPRVLAGASELLLDALPPLQPQMRFLEVGAAGGLVARTLVERIAGLGRLVATDVDPALVAALPTGARRAARAVAGLPLPFVDGGFDVVLSNLGLGGPDDDALLAELRRVLKPGGSLVATALVRGAWDALFDLVAEAGETAGHDDISDAVQRARDALPTEGALVAHAAAHGLVAHAGLGLEERLVAFAADGLALRADPLVRDVLLPSWLADVYVDPPSFCQAVDDVARAFFPAGVPVVARTVVLPLRAA